LGELPEFSITQFAAHTRAFVKVQDGCNSFCSYCIIPYVRGRSRSRPIEEILREIEELVKNGYKEIVLTGINIGDFEDKGVQLAGLVKLVDQMPIDRLRISSIDPDEVNDELMETVCFGQKTCHSMHVVLQSGSNAILKRMNRKYTRQIFLNTVDRLKEAAPDFTFTTDVIVGFPGETESDFQETLAVMEQVKFAKVHMFPYSVRQRTKAALFPEKVTQEVMNERKSRVLRLAEKMAYELRESYVGKKVSVLTEEANFGHTANFLPVLVEAKANQIVEVVLKSNSEKGLIADAYQSQAAI
jgi:threonylcarbamoyladenosine tRNA methylthiotransferase MtaB